MNNIPAAKVKTSATVLEITGFSSPETLSLNEIFTQALQQPSYVSRAVLKKDARGDLQLVLVCPFGFIVSVLFLYGNSINLYELSHCCLAELKNASCSSCSSPFTSEAITLARVNLFPLQDEEEETSESKKYFTADELEKVLVKRLEAFDLDLFLAYLISAELRELMVELSAFNSR